MQVINSPAQARQLFDHCVATIGKYDGMHLGHQRILDALLQEARAMSLPSVVVLSEPQPEEFFAGPGAPPRLNHFDDKVRFLETYGVDAVYMLRFDLALSRQSPGDFVRQFLLGTLGISNLVVGDDFRFGHNRAGDIKMLQELGELLKFRVQAIAPCCESGERVSSTLIRQYLAAGDLARVGSLLGRPYSIGGRIVRGRQLGRQIGVPTANIRLLSPTLPMTGVYAVKAQLQDAELEGVANLGYKPTVTNDSKPSLEVHLLDFAQDIYDEVMQVIFVKKLRNEQKFNGLQELQQQIMIDIARARACFALPDEQGLV